MDRWSLFSLPVIDNCRLILSVIQIYFLHKDFIWKATVPCYLVCSLFGRFTAEAYSEPSQTSEMEFFCENSSFQPWTIFAKNSILVIRLAFECTFVVYLQKSNVSTKYRLARINPYHSITDTSFNENRIIFGSFLFTENPPLLPYHCLSTKHFWINVLPSNTAQWQVFAVFQNISLCTQCKRWIIFCDFESFRYTSC